MIALKKALAEYITVLEDSSAAAGRGENHRHFQLHLASAALMFAAMEKHQSVDRLKVLIAGERRAYDLAPLPGPPGKAAAGALDAFAALVEKTFPSSSAGKPVKGSRPAAPGVKPVKDASPAAPDLAPLKKADSKAPEVEPEERSVMASTKEEKKRFEVQFELFPPPNGGMARYEVFTHMGAAKAIVIAALKHTARKGHPIFRVLPVKSLPGDSPQKKDLLDRLEW